MEHDLPEGWAWTTLGEICVEPEYGYTTKATSVQHGPQFLRITDLVADGTVDWTKVPYCAEIPDAGDKYRLHDGDIVIARTGATVGKAYHVSNPPDAVFASYLIRFRPLVSSRFIEFFLKSSGYWEQIADNSTGTAQDNVNAQKLKNVRLPLAPLPEQNRVIARLDTLFAQIRATREALNTVPTLIKQFRRSVLAAAFRGDLTERDPNDEPASVLLDRIRAERRRKWEADLRAKGKHPAMYTYEEPAPPDTSNLPELPQGWMWTTLPAIGALARGKSKHRPRDDKRLYGGPYPFIQTGDVRRADSTITSYSDTYNDFGLAQSRLWPAGTLCITIAANIADTAILGFDACFPDSVVGFVADVTACDVKLIEYYMRTVKDDLEQFAPATAQKNINLDTLQNLAIMLPPRNEQTGIVIRIEDLFSQARVIDETVTAAHRQLDDMERSILARAFRGELVPQDPDDESASALLERIRTQRTARGLTKKNAKPRRTE